MMSQFPSHDATGDAVRELRKNRKVLKDVLMTEDLKSALVQNDIFPPNTIEELFLVAV